MLVKKWPRNIAKKSLKLLVKAADLFQFGTKSLAGFLLLYGHDSHYAHNWNRLLSQADPPKSQGGGNARQRDGKTKTGGPTSTEGDRPSTT